MRLFWKIFVPVFIFLIIVISFFGYKATTQKITNKEGIIIEKYKIISDLTSKEIERNYPVSGWSLDTLGDISKHDDFLFWWIVTDEGDIYLADNESFVGNDASRYFHRTNKEISLDYENDYGFIVKQFRAGGEDWSFWLGFSLKELSKAREEAIMIIPLSSLSLIAVGIVLLGIIRYFTRPIYELTEATRKLEKGDFSARAYIRTGDELEQLGNTLNKAIKRLGAIDREHKQLDHAKTEFLSITSHELRSPMTPMRAQLQMLLAGYFGNLTGKQKESIDIVLRNTERLDNIIQDFLEISRIEAARLKFKFIRIDLTKHINMLIEEMEGFMPEKNIKILLKIKKLPQIEVDPDRVMQVLRNLINNAKKFSPKDGKIFIDVMVKGNMILFSVRDQGIGLSSSNKIRIFEPFFQAEQTMYRKQGGTGLGLAICRGIIGSQGGRIWVESEEGKGTKFYFTIPLKPVREMKPIKVLFSEQEDLKMKIRKLFIGYLGPLGEQEFERLKNQGLNYEIIRDYFSFLGRKKIISKASLEMIDKDFLSIFGVKKIINVPEIVNKKYIDVLGPLGKKRFDMIKKVTANGILGDINDLENNKILNTTEASIFRDYVVNLFRRKELGVDEDSRQSDETTPEEEISSFISG